MKYFLLASLFLVGQILSQKEKFAVDERWVCNIKRSCLECLRLPHCSWCEESSKCFSKNLPNMEDFCKDNATHYIDHGMSFEENAKCACMEEALEKNCHPPGVTDGLECFGRGKCDCGRCVCDPQPDPNNVTKTVMGEYCEFDNFSCNGLHCNEGPYHINQIYDNIEEI